MNNKILVTILILTYTSYYSKCSAATVENLLNIDDYLERYGYMESRGERRRADATLNSDAFRNEAIRKFQAFVGLEATGELDEATILAMKKPRCGVKDIPGPSSPSNGEGPLNFFAPGLKWPGKTVTWKTSAPTGQLQEATQRYAFENAFKYWSDVTPLKFEYTYGDKPDIDIKFAKRDHGDGRYNAFDGKGGVLAHAYYPTNGDTHFDDEERWVFRSNDGTDLETVAAHEFGHALGLGHSSEPASLMAPFYKGFDPAFKLHNDDILGNPISIWYVKPFHKCNRSKENTPPTTTSRPTTTQSTTAATPLPPSVCTMKFDAITLGPDGYTYAFRNKQVYRLNSTGVVSTMLSRHLYPGCPSYPGAAVYIQNTGKTFIFKGNRIWRYTGFQLDADYPITFDNSNFPARVHAGIGLKNERSGNQQIYLFGDEYFWEFNTNTNQIVPGFPLKISDFWRGIPEGVEAALQWTDGDIYFFKGNKYRRYDPRLRTLKPGYPKDKAPAWLGGVCGSAPK